VTQRWKLTIEYDGSGFVGWQKQAKGVSVQACLEEAVLKFSGETVFSIVAGRTDSGVHAAGQVAHIDLEKDWEARTVRDAINYHLHPRAAAVLKAEAVPLTFDARLSALRRVYCYSFFTGRSAPPMIGGQYMWHVWKELDAEAMQAAANVLLGTHDFSSFRAADCQAKSPLRTLDRLEFVAAQTPHTLGKKLELWAGAKSFLHHQIRNIAGTLKLVGEGKWAPADVARALAARDRTQAGPMAPAHGLCFMRVDYP
jgi:tRNA pseudouridine38-40 synthase